MRNLWTFALCAFTCFAYPIASNAQEQKNSAEQAKDLLRRTAMLQATWSDIHTPKGSHLEAVLLRQEKAEDGSARQLYEFRINGIPTSGPYTLEEWPIGIIKFATLFKNLSVSADGLLVCGDEAKLCGESSKFHQPVTVWMNAAQGEPLRFLLSSDNDKVSVTGMSVPFPASGSDGGCRIQLLRVLSQGEMFFLRGEGFPPRSEVTLLIDVAGKKDKAKAKVTEDGLILRAETPLINGAPATGELTESVVAGAPCHPSAKIMFGAGSEKKM
jgi:hypothetical protein